MGARGVKRVKKLHKHIRQTISSLTWKNFFMLTIAGIINAIGVTMFLAPVHLYDGGISGTSMLLDRITPAYLTLSIFLLILNVPLFLIGLKRQGSVFTIYAIYVVVIYSVSAWIINHVLPVDVTSQSPFAEGDLLLCAIFGGLISGIGSGLAIRFGGAMDGIEVMAVIFAKKIGVSVGTFVMAYNVCVYVIGGVVMGSWILPLYSIIAYAIGSKAVDYLVEGFDHSKSAMIITTYPDEICQALTSTFSSGATRMEARGGFSNEEKTVVYFVVNRFQVGKMKDIVYAIDEHAYISISEVADVYSKKK
jgi:uncharacterized membrane-anchored protein YitT (DUF2179 family)